jgi:hypothetical protein
VDKRRLTKPGLELLKPILTRHKGFVEVYVQASAADGRSVMMKLDRQWWVRPAGDMIKDLEGLLGPGSVQLAGAGSRRRARPAQQPLFVEEPVEVSALPLEMEEV